MTEPFSVDLSIKEFEKILEEKLKMSDQVLHWCVVKHTDLQRVVLWYRNPDKYNVQSSAEPSNQLDAALLSGLKDLRGSLKVLNRAQVEEALDRMIRGMSDEKVEEG